MALIRKKGAGQKIGRHSSTKMDCSWLCRSPPREHDPIGQHTTEIAAECQDSMTRAFCGFRGQPSRAGWGMDGCHVYQQQGGRPNKPGLIILETSTDTTASQLQP